MDTKRNLFVTYGFNKNSFTGDRFTDKSITEVFDYINRRWHGKYKVLWIDEKLDKGLGNTLWTHDRKGVLQQNNRMELF